VNAPAPAWTMHLDLTRLKSGLGGQFLATHGEKNGKMRC
jgi:hypothetical protein